MSSESSQLRRMMAGDLYRPADPFLAAARMRARLLVKAFNDSQPDDIAGRDRMLRELLGGVGAAPDIEPPLRCDYGFNIHLGERVFMNFGCVLLDCNRIAIGDRTLIGPGVHIYTGTHPLQSEIRAEGLELALPVSIGSDAWIGGGAIICPGVTVGHRCVIGAGSVVTRSIPPNTLALGNPCRAIRTL